MTFRRVLIVMLLAAAILGGLQVSAFAEETPLSPADVIAIERELDETVVLIRGEAIGEALRADAGHRWVNVLGGGVAIGVWMPESISSQIENFGYYKHYGDTLLVEGVMNLACERHGGEFDVHADVVEIVETGDPREDPVHPWKLTFGLAGIALGLAEYRAYRYLKDRGPR